MRPDVITVDYFLRDNRTWAPTIGKDWGIKAATGALTDRTDLRSEFDRYCRAHCDARGDLSGFGHAIGGIRSTDGYLLCITLETSDPFGRPSWAIYGLWCPRDTVADVALCDPAATVQALLRAEDPPGAITLQPRGTAPRPSTADTGQPLRPFDRGSTSAEVLSLLLAAHRTGAPLPSILGITSSAGLLRLVEEFDLVYCHPQDDDARLAFERLRTRTVARAQVMTKIAPARIPWPRQRMLWATLLALVAVGAVLVRATPLLIAPRFSAALPPEPLHPTYTRAARADPVAARITSIEALDPDDLRRTSGYKTIVDDGAQENRLADRQKIRDAYASLIELRARIVIRPDSQVATLRNIYSRGRQPPAEACRTIRDTFRSEFDAPDSAARIWCESLVELQTLTDSPRTLDTSRHAADLKGRKRS